MDKTIWSDEKQKELISECASHAWDRREKHFQKIGIESAAELRTVLNESIRKPETRSYDRQPEATLQQTERSQVFQIEHIDPKGKPHILTAVLNPDVDLNTGKVAGGTVVITEQRDKQTDFSRWLCREMDEKGRAPEILIRGPEIGLPEQQVSKSPVSRLSYTQEVFEDRAAKAKQPSLPLQIPQDKGHQRNETLLERIDRERKERGDVALREVGKDRSLEQKREQERGL